MPKTLTSDKENLGDEFNSSPSLSFTSYCTLPTTHKRDVTTPPLSLALLEENTYPHSPLSLPLFTMTNDPVQSPKRPNIYFSFLSPSPHPNFLRRLLLAAHLDYAISIVSVSPRHHPSSLQPAQITKAHRHLYSLFTLNNAQGLQLLTPVPHHHGLHRPHPLSEISANGPLASRSKTQKSAQISIEQEQPLTLLSDTTLTDKTNKKATNGNKKEPSPPSQIACHLPHDEAI